MVAQGLGLVEETRTLLEEQATSQVQQLSTNLRRFSAETQALAEGRPSEPGELPAYLESMAGRLQGVADDLDTRGVEGIVDDVKAFARRRPGVFLLGAAAVGFGAGRLIRAQSDEGDGEEDPAVPVRVARPVRASRSTGAVVGRRQPGRAEAR